MPVVIALHNLWLVIFEPLFIIPVLVCQCRLFTLPTASNYPFKLSFSNRFGKYGSRVVLLKNALPEDSIAILSDV